MDLNLVVLAGRLAAPPEIRRFESGTSLVRVMLTVRTEEPRRRIDVLPVTLWDPSDALLDGLPAVGGGLWVAGAVQRRFWEAEEGRKSRIEVIAHHIEPRDEEGDESS